MVARWAVDCLHSEAQDDDEAQICLIAPDGGEATAHGRHGCRTEMNANGALAHVVGWPI
jgi:hypothetical protein